MFHTMFSFFLVSLHKKISNWYNQIKLFLQTVEMRYLFSPDL